MTQLTDEGFVRLSANQWLFAPDNSRLIFSRDEGLAIGIIAHGVMLSSFHAPRKGYRLFVSQLFGPKAIVEGLVGIASAPSQHSSLEWELKLNGIWVRACRLVDATAEFVGVTVNSGDMALTEVVSYSCRDAQISTHPDVLDLINGWKRNPLLDPSLGRPYDSAG